MHQNHFETNLTNAKHTIKTWQLEGILLEWYHLVPGPAGPIPKHCHPEYQLGFSQDTNGGYFYRGGGHPVPMGHFSLLHSGEVHATTRKQTWLEQYRTYWMLYIHPDRLSEVFTALSGSSTGLPFFDNPVIYDRTLATQFLQFFGTFQQQTSTLERTTLLSICLNQLIQRHAEQRVVPQIPKRDRHRVQQVQDYLMAHLTENVSLDQLAQLVGLSPYHLHHIFQQEVGMAPHQYQIQARVNRAKQLLHQGLSLRQVAEDAGFSDQSHLTRQFKRFLQVTPGRYLRQK
ncbi:AraC family transcriptional regulator [Leptolyngbyaceae cyanobacterium CCMR0082]|uniref:AraC family transcriptional regulator n=1 Tax=Adonisia turfae CCMR0082 TaxID=2304604 RepID=A0A6M0SD43_9CYAN|nr:AraC family transcriptional regulator [Adonisia turfae]NEZ66417.1 AraC family transcriptional regulator [Adonisia turfae CCMR0082]